MIDFPAARRQITRVGENFLLRKGASMLVLSRKKNESIVINGNIAVVVVEVRGDKVRLGIDAPKDISVHRKEIFDAIHSPRLPGIPVPESGPTVAKIARDG